MSDHKALPSYPQIFNAVTLAQNPKPAQWVVSNLLAKGTEIHLFGEEGGGKSRLAWQLAYSIATGEPWLGVFPILQTGPVLYLQCDMDRPEIDKLLEDADIAGIVSDQIIIPEPRVSLDIIGSRPDRDWLRSLGDDHSPLVTICDTVNEAGICENTNKETTRFLKNYRDIYPDSGNILINHERKAGTDKDGRVMASNKNSYLGGAWTRKTRTSIQLISYTDKFPVTGKLAITKHRAPPIASSIKLEQNVQHGFWRATMDPKMALTTFPHCIPSENGRSDPGCETVADVCRSIAEAFNLKEDTVRQSFDRERKLGITYPWVESLPGYQPKTLL